MKNKFDLSPKGEALYQKLLTTPRDFTDDDAFVLRDELTKTLNAIKENLFDAEHGPAAKAAQVKTGMVVDLLHHRQFSNTLTGRTRSGKGAGPQINPFAGCDEETIENMLVGGASLTEKGEAADFYRLADRKAARRAAAWLARNDGATAGDCIAAIGEKWSEEAPAFLSYMQEMDMTASIEKKSAAVPAYLKDFCYSIRDQRFVLVDTDMVLVMGISRGYYKTEVDSPDYRATCNLYIAIEPVEAAKRAKECRPVPRVSFSNYLNSSDNLKTLHVSGNRAGLRMMLPNGEIDFIDRREQERLLAFLNELRGIRLKYVANIFGFIEKDGSDVEVVTELRFPAETCNPDD